MPLATQTNRTLAANWTEQAFIDALRLALKAAGFPATEFDYRPATATSVPPHRYMVFEFVGDGSKAKGRSYLRIRWAISGGAYSLFSTLFDTWSLANRTGTGQGVEVASSFSLLPSAAVDFYSFSHPEIRHVAINQGNSWASLNFIRPANKINVGPTVLFEEATFPYGFISAGNDLSFIYGCEAALSPSGADGSYQVENMGHLAARNAATNRVQVIPAPKLYGANSNQGVFAQFSTDVGICASQGMTPLTEVNDATRRVLLIPRGNSGIVLNCEPTAIQA
jgi:hypothetical protein